VGDVWYGVVSGGRVADGLCDRFLKAVWLPHLWEQPGRQHSEPLSRKSNDWFGKYPDIIVSYAFV
jgi:hypothetical protein